jgi:hypothetical protein
MTFHEFVDRGMDIAALLVMTAISGGLLLGVVILWVQFLRGKLF